ncbi:hypothetical protein ACS0TY_007850 [Phlomoides rotata]
MANKQHFSTFLHLSILLLVSLVSLQSYAQTPSIVCNSTPDPSFCKMVLPTTNSSSTIYDYGRFSVRKSLFAARKFLSLIDKHRLNSKALTITAIRALQDCNFLAQCNIDNLITSFQIINKTSQTLSVHQGDDIQTLLSAILTNTQTCMDGIQSASSSWSLTNGVATPLANDTRLFSVSLALFTKGWVPKKRRKPSSSRHPSKQLKLHNGRLNLEINSGQNRAIYRAVNNNRKLLQLDDVNSQVNVSDIVVVSQDGSWNFTSINDAISVAPNNTNGSNGYFLIYITAGVYEEYIAIPKNKKYLMMVGDGINQTIITGNHSVVDGWTTFNSATFCNIEAYQDTLYVHSLRQFYLQCDIYGTVDFIFGNAAVVFQTCNLYPRLPMANQFNAITAQGRTDINQNTGISIQNCSIRAADDLAQSNSTIQTYLGRPWKEYSRTVYMQSFLDGLINPAGWREWSGDFALNTSYYAEFGNSGPGSNTTRRVTWPGFHTNVKRDKRQHLARLRGNFKLRCHGRRSLKKKEM